MKPLVDLPRQLRFNLHRSRRQHSELGEYSLLQIALYVAQYLSGMF